MRRPVLSLVRAGVTILAGVWLGIAVAARPAHGQAATGADDASGARLPGEDRALDGSLPGADPAAPSFGPGYVIEDVIVVGNHKTHPSVVLRELELRPGDVVGASDPRVEASRLRLLSLGHFLDVRLALARGVRRGGAVLTVTVEERGTIVLTGLFLGTSEATQLWAGLDLTETNFLGRGILLGGGFVSSSTPTVPGARAGQAFRLRTTGPELGSMGLALSGSVLASNGSEFFRAFGPSDGVSPANHVAVGTRRLGGTLGVGTALARTVQIQSDARFESVSAELPEIRSRDLGGGLAKPIDFSIREGASRVSSLSLTLDVDTRSDPILPHSGRRLLINMEISSPALGSSYAFAKGTLRTSSYHPVGKRGHTLGLHGFVGAVFGNAPYFDRFFVGDLNLLLPPRVLGLNFSTLPSRDVFGSAIPDHRYDSYAARTMVEYAVPLLRRRGFVYRGDAFVALGAFALASDRDLRARDGAWAPAIPIDLTGDLGVRLDTAIGIFTLSVANALGRIPF